MGSFDRDYFASWSSTYFHRRVTHLTALRVFRLGAWSAVMLDASQGPRDESVRARKAARRVAFRGHRRASATLDDPSSAAAARPSRLPELYGGQSLPLRRVDVQTSPARRFLPGGREKTIICITLL